MAKQKILNEAAFDMIQVTKAIAKAVANAYAKGYNDALQDVRSAMDKKVRRVRP